MLDRLILEVTENSLLEDTPGLIAEISRLIATGINFAVDGMGAGYSGLRQITTVRPSYLKLDRSLISGIDTDADRGAPVSAMLGYVHYSAGRTSVSRPGPVGPVAPEERGSRRCLTVRFGAGCATA